jgi:UDP-N-acetylmuramyl pentapeptide phosphotransferase/UDP-N-acetylglucosamine-1-phosphate transferase
MIWLVIACGVGAFSWWLTGWLANRISLLGPIDHPNDRSLHQHPTPRTGGIAIIVSMTAGILVSSAMALSTDMELRNRFSRLPEAGWLLGGTLFLACVSFLDDRKGLSVVVRFALHLLAACGVVFGGGVMLHSVSIPGWEPLTLGWAAVPVSLLVLLWMTNLYNFMDGMDGFAGGMTLIGGLTLAFLTSKGNAVAVSIPSLLLAGAATGFLVHNFPPARIFMGDVGSIPIGFFFGAVILLGSRDGLFEIWVPLIVFSPFVVDATATVIRRILAGEKIWEAHRAHYYQRLVLLGWGHRRTVLAEYGLMVFCAALAWFYHIGNDSMRLLVLCLWCLVFSGLMAVVVMAERAAGQRQFVA